MAERNTNVHFKGEKSTRKFNVESKSCAERDKNIKEKPNPQWDKSKEFPEDMTSAS